MIYFDNAATTIQKPPEVARAVAHAINTFGGVGRGVCEASLKAGIAVYETREKIAQLFGVSNARNVVFCANATEALNIVAGSLKKGDHVVTTAASHNSVLRPLYRRRDEEGVELSIAPIGQDGTLDYDAFEELIQDNTRLALVTHASNLTGDVYDCARLAYICHKKGIMLAVDAAQSAGHVPLSMEVDGIDMLVFTGHKSLFGPQGTGGLCLSPKVELSPLLVGGSGTHSFDRSHPSFMPERLEAGTLNSHGIAGLSAGLTFLEEVGVSAIGAHIAALRQRFLCGIAAEKDITIYGNPIHENCGIVALNVGTYDSALVSEVLASDFDICTRSGVHCAPLMHKALGTEEQGAVRISFSWFNTEAEVDRCIDAFTHIKQVLLRVR